MRGYGMVRTYAKCRTRRKHPSSKIQVKCTVYNRRAARRKNKLLTLAD